MTSIAYKPYSIPFCSVCHDPPGPEITLIGHNKFKALSPDELSCPICTKCQEAWQKTCQSEGRPIVCPTCKVVIPTETLPIRNLSREIGDLSVSIRELLASSQRMEREHQNFYDMISTLLEKIEDLKTVSRLVLRGAVLGPTFAVSIIGLSFLYGRMKHIPLPEIMMELRQHLVVGGIGGAIGTGIGSILEEYHGELVSERNESYQLNAHLGGNYNILLFAIISSLFPKQTISESLKYSSLIVACILALEMNDKLLNQRGENYRIDIRHQTRNIKRSLIAGSIGFFSILGIEAFAAFSGATLRSDQFSFAFLKHKKHIFENATAGFLAAATVELFSLRAFDDHSLRVNIPCGITFACISGSINTILSVTPIGKNPLHKIYTSCLLTLGLYLAHKNTYR